MRGKFPALLMGLVALAAYAQGHKQVTDNDLLRLHLFWNDHDNLSCVSINNEDVMKLGDGYRSVRWEGRILKVARPGTRPLRLFRSKDKQDYMTCATTASLARAKEKGYQQISLLGYVYDQPLPGLKPITLYYNPDRRDYFTTGTAVGMQSAESAGYQTIGVEGYVYQSREKGADPESPPLNLRPGKTRF